MALPIDNPDNHEKMEACLDLLGLALLADRLERDSEMVEMCHSALMLARHIAPEAVLSRRDIRVWFEENRERLCDIRDDEAEIRAALGRVTDPELRRLALPAIFAISVCDYHLADEESAMIRMALEEWSPRDLTPETLAVLD